MESKMGFQGALAFRPVGMAPHMAHLDFSPGYVNLQTHFTSELSMAESLHIIGEISSAFMGFDGSDPTESLNVYKKYYMQALDLLSSYRDLAKIQNTSWCGAYAQKEVLHL